MESKSPDIHTVDSWLKVKGKRQDTNRCFLLQVSQEAKSQEKSAQARAIRQKIVYAERRNLSVKKQRTMRQRAKIQKVKG